MRFFVVMLLAAPALAGKPMYMSIGKDGVPVVTDYPRGDAVHYEPGDFERVAMRQKNVPHRGFVTERGFGGQTTAPAEVEVLLVSASARHGVPLSLLRAVVSVESGFNANAVSRAGAMGLMQLMPATAKDLGVKDPFDPKQNVDGGTRYLAFLLKHFKDTKLAVAAYNAGPGRVARAGRIPNIPETQAYVRQVVALAAAWD